MPRRRPVSSPRPPARLALAGRSRARLPRWRRLPRRRRCCRRWFVRTRRTAGSATEPARRCSAAVHSTRRAARSSRRRRRWLRPGVQAGGAVAAHTRLTAGIAGTLVPRCMAAVRTTRRAARSSRRRRRILRLPRAQGGAGAVAGSYAPHCWYSWNACPTMYGCGPHHTPGCPQFQAQAQDPAAAPPRRVERAAIAGSYAPHCWYSWNACPTMYGCGPHHTPGCPQFQAQRSRGGCRGAQGGGAAIAGSYAPHCWYSWNACPTMYGCGPHHTPGCPQFR